MGFSSTDDEQAASTTSQTQSATDSAVNPQKVASDQLSTPEATDTAQTATTQGSFETFRAEAKQSWPLKGTAAKKKSVPIVMYHVISSAQPAGGDEYADLWVTPDLFAQQLTALKQAGFEAITMQELFDAWRNGSQLPQKPVVLSFDDGDISHALNAAPPLLKLRWPGVLNLKLGNLGNSGLPLWGAKRLIKQGWEFGSHTISHRDLTTLNSTDLRRELVDSKAQIQTKLGVEAKFFCYPAGRYNSTVEAAVKAAGYLGATTVDPGIAKPSSRFTALPRVRVKSGTSGSQLVAMVSR